MPPISRITQRAFFGSAIIVIAIGVFESAPAAASEKVLHSFQGGTDGLVPYSSLITDAAGNFYGTTAGGGGGSGCQNGQQGCGTVFKLAPDGMETILYAFQGGSDGAFPRSGVIADSAGNLYGMTEEGGGGTCDNGCGVVFKLAPDGTETILLAFTGGSDGSWPVGNLIQDNAGNLYGAAARGGNLANCEGNGCGVIFELSPDGTETVLYTFQGGSDGAGPEGGLIADAAGNLFGATQVGGGCSYVSAGCGTVFRLAPNGTETVLYAFQGNSDGYFPAGGVVGDKAGNFYGATFAGGLPCGCGTVFKVTPGGKEKQLYVFQGGSDGQTPFAGVVRDKQGNLYGTTYVGGSSHCKGGGCGEVFKLAPDGTRTELYAFGKPHGINPAAGLLLGKHGEIYGTTTAGGKSGANCPDKYGCGVVFEVTK